MPYYVLIRILPKRLLRRLEQRPNLVKILNNIGWLFFDKLFRIGVGLFVGVWVARYLGPEQFGQLNYVIAFVGLFGSIAGLGLNGIVVRDIITNPEKTNTTMGTAFILLVLAALFSIVLSVVTIAWLRPNDNTTLLMVTLLSFGLLFRSSEVTAYWFESQLQSRYTILVENSIFLVMATLKISMIINKAPLILFVWISLIEAILVSIGLIAIYHRKTKQLINWNISIARAKAILSESWPLALSGITIMIYMRIDQIMLGEMIGNDAVGIYSAATKISEMWYFVPMAIVTSLFPSIISAKAKDEKTYNNYMQKIYSILFITSFVIALIIQISSDWIIRNIYGGNFQGAAELLKIHIWTGIFVSMGIASSNWYLSEGLQKLAFYRTLLGAVVNITGNYIFIPLYGATGAALSTLISQISAAYLFDLTHSKTRVAFVMKSASFLLAGLIKRNLK